MSELSVGVTLARLSFLKLLAYRLRYITGYLTYLVMVAVNDAIWGAVFTATESAEIGNFDRAQITTYLVMAYALRSFYFNDIDKDLNQQVLDGTLSMTLARPLSLHRMGLWSALGGSLFRLFIFTTPIMVILCLVYQVQAPVSLGHGFLFLLSMGAAWWIFAEISTLVGVCIIYLKNGHGLMMARTYIVQLLGGTFIPLSFFPLWAAEALEWTPFPWLGYIPVSKIYQGLDTSVSEAAGYCLQGYAWGLGLHLIAAFCLRRSLKSLTVNGG